MAENRTGTIDGAEGVAALVGVTLGVIPLVQLVLGGGPGLLRFVLGSERDTTAYVVPGLVIVVAVVAVALLERANHQR